MTKNAGENAGSGERDKRGRFRPGNRAGTRSSGGKAGRSGRPPADFHGWVEAMRDGPARAAVERILRNGRDDLRLRAAALVFQYAARGDAVVPIAEVVETLRAIFVLVDRHAGPESAERISAEIEAQLRAAGEAAEPYPRLIAGTLLRLRPRQSDGRRRGGRR